MAKNRKNTSISVNPLKLQVIRSVFAAFLGIVITVGSMGIAGQVIPNDLSGEYWPMQWYLYNTGQSNGTPDADINAPEAWEITTGDPNIVIAILDTGVDLNHPDLINNLVPGYDFLDDDDSPVPVVGTHRQAPHGTACAGIVAAQGNNGMGVVGVTWDCKIMPIRVGLSPTVTADTAAKAIRWAADNGADVLSCSFTVNNSPILEAAIMDVTKIGGIGRDGKGCIVFFSAGNDNGYITGIKERSDVITVGATDDNDTRWSYSNYGPGLDIVAPAGGPGDLWTMTTDITGAMGYMSDDYTFFSHTSGACPIVAGVAALILSVEPDLTSEEVRHFLTRSAKDLGDPGRDDYYGWGRVDARAALDMVLARRVDLNNNWKVDLEDLLILIESWDTVEPWADIAPATKCDGIVDELDLELLMRYWLTDLPELGLIAHWKLDETEGVTAHNSVNGNEGYVSGNALWQPMDGKVDGALQFDGIDDYVITPFILNPADGSFSIFAWIKGGIPGQAVISQQGGTCWLMADTIDGSLRSNLRTPTTTGRGAMPPGPHLISSTVITDGEWHHISFIRSDSDRILYVDHTQVARDTAETLESAYGGLYIGAGSDLELETYWLGLIDDIRIYGKALSEEEIAALP